MATVIAGSEPTAPVLQKKALNPPKAVEYPSANPPTGQKDQRVDPKTVTEHPTKPRAIEFRPTTADQNRFNRLANHFGSFASPEQAVNRSIGELISLFHSAKGRSGSISKGDFKVTIQGNTLTVTNKNPNCTIVLVCHKGGGVHVEGKGSFKETKATFSGFWKNGRLSIGEMKASYKGIGAVHRGNVAGLPPCAVSFGSLAPDVQAKYKPILEALGVDFKAAWVYWNCATDLEGLHLELGILRKNPGGGFGAFAVTGDKGWEGTVQAACTFFEKKLLPKLSKAAPKLAPKAAKVVPVVGQAATAFEAGWTAGRAIGKTPINGKTVDLHMQELFLRLMGVKE